jgi:putative ABC transport system permease protein
VADLFECCRACPQSDLTAMSALRALKRRLDVLIDQPSVERALDEELRMHLELEAEDLIRRGLPADEAHRQAAIAFGGLQQVKEAALERSTFQWLRDLRRDARIAARTLARQRTFAITAILALGLAIAVNTTMFSVVDAMLHPPTALRHPERLATIRYWGVSRLRLDPTEGDRALREGGATYASFSAHRWSGQLSVERGGSGQLATSLVARANFFETLDAAPTEGRLVPGQDLASVASSVVISERLRAQLFPDRVSAVGERVLIDGSPLSVIGVVRRSNDVGLDADLWRFAPDDDFRSATVLRLRAGEMFESAERELALMAARLAQAGGEPTSTVRVQLKPLSRQFSAKREHFALLGATLAVLLVACTNLGNLQLARGLGRAGELAVRASLGATRKQIVAQLVLESAVLVATGLLLSLLFSYAANAWVRASIPPEVGDYTIIPKADSRMLLFAMGAAVVSVVTTGFAPALHVSRLDLNTLIKSRTGTGEHRRRRPLYGGLVALQIGLTMPLVFTAVFLARQSWDFTRDDYYFNKLGYDPRPLVTVLATIGPVEKGGPSLADLMADLVRRARALPGVTNATASLQAPTVGHALTVDGPDGALREVGTPNFSYKFVTPGYFETFGLAVAKGRAFPDGLHAASAVIVDEFTAAYLWPYADPVGRRIRFGPARSAEPWVPVEGVLANRMSGEAREIAAINMGSRVNAAYRVISVDDTLPSRTGMASLTLTLRAQRDPSTVAVVARRAMHGVGVRAPLVVPTLEWMGLAKQVAAARFGAMIASVFALIAIGLSALGVYGVVVQAAADRRREVAVRVSLGATSRQIVRALIRDGNVFVLAGLLLGQVLTVVVARWLGVAEAFESRGLLFGGIIASLFVIMALAGLLPAYRATLLDPMEVLRAE